MRDDQLFGVVAAAALLIWLDPPNQRKVLDDPQSHGLGAPLRARIG